jgi:hypothetical protein
MVNCVTACVFAPENESLSQYGTLLHELAQFVLPETEYKRSAIAD